MTENRFMTEKVFLADIKPVPLQILLAKAWRKMAVFVGNISVYVGIMMDYVAAWCGENGGSCRSVWRIMSGLCWLMTRYGVAENGGLCRDCGEVWQTMT